MKSNDLFTPEQALRRLISGNDIYRKVCRNPADISSKRRTKTAHHGQTPFAAVLTCSDSRVPPEHIFSAGLGEIFVVRTAGNVAGDFEIGSIEYAVEHLHVPVVVVMGHTHCGAVAAALEGYAHGYIGDIADEIRLGLRGTPDENEAIRQNVVHSRRRILQSKIVKTMCRTGEIKVVCAIYNIQTGHVKFLTDEASVKSA
ncbi:MAG: carbonic anhydrase [Oscillospiraceae bacterium]|nr:carbonic anhydrase [Oscillospiraceae bacterium]